MKMTIMENVGYSVTAAHCSILKHAKIYWTELDQRGSCIWNV